VEEGARGDQDARQAQEETHYTYKTFRGHGYLGRKVGQQPQPMNMLWNPELRATVRISIKGYYYRVKINSRKKNPINGLIFSRKTITKKTLKIWICTLEPQKEERKG
jgi:hypothetical protein